MATAVPNSPIEVSVSAQRSEGSRMPRAGSVKLPKEMWPHVYWVARIKGIGPGELLKELAGVAVAAQYKRFEAEVARLKKLDAEAESVVRRAQQRTEE